MSSQANQSAELHEEALMSEARRAAPWAARLPARWVAALATLGAAAALALLPTVRAGAHDQSAANSYEQTNLVSDIPGVAEVTDPNLVNPWGVSAGPTTPLWVSDAVPGVTTLYSGGFDHQPPAIVTYEALGVPDLGRGPLVVSIPGGLPTGQVFNPTSGFVLGSGPGAAPARFIFDTLGGVIAAWHPGLSPANAAVQVVKTPEAIYTGLALATGKRGTLLYAANFHAGTIDVFDDQFAPVNLPNGFVDKKLPEGYAPFNIQEIGGRLYVAYALQDEDREDEVRGPGNGFVDVFTPNGRLVRRLVAHGALNAPWGLAVAPDAFGAFGGALLVGNFGDGTINAYDPKTGSFRGTLKHEDGSTIAIDGLWALRFGNGVAGSPQTLLFTAGIDDGAHGLFGSLEPDQD